MIFIGFLSVDWYWIMNAKFNFMTCEFIEYFIQPIPKAKKDVLIIHDSFFDEAYAPNTYLSNYFNLEYQRWSKDIDLDNKAMEFDFVLIESSIETFFETRISNINNK